MISLILLFFIFIIGAALWKNIMITLVVLFFIAIGAALLIGAWSITALITESAAMGWLVAAVTAICECKWGYRLFYDHD